MRYSRRRVIAAAAVTALAGCLGQDDGSPTPTDDPVIEARAASFSPVWLPVEVGTTVTVEHQAGDHTVTLFHADNDVPHRAPDAATAFDRELTSGSVSITVDHEGVYGIFCRPHASAGMATAVVAGTPTEDDPGLAPAQDELTDAMRDQLDGISADIRNAYGLNGDSNAGNGGGPGY